MARPNPETEYQSISRTVTTNSGTTSSYVSTQVYDRSYVSFNTPGFPDVKPLPYHAHTVLLRRRRPGSWEYYRYVSPTNWTKYKGPSSGFSLGWPSVETTLLLTDMFTNSGEHKARSKVISDIQRIKVNVAQNVAEYRQVHNLFVTNARRIALAYTALKRGDIKGLSRRVNLRRRHEQSLLNRGPGDIRRNAPSIWLEVQYGVRPLVGDIYTGMQEFYKRVESGYPILAKGSGVYVEANTKTYPAVSGILPKRYFVTKWLNQYIIEYEVDHTQLANLDDWGVTNPMLLAWELLPYSFVVDWFLPVGDWLSQVGYSLGLHFRRGMRTSFVRSTATCRGVPSSSVIKSVSGSDLEDYVRVRREVINDFPNPGLPRIDRDGLRGTRVLNAMSLLALAFDRKPRG